MAVDVASADLTSVDLTDLDLWADGPPYGLFARMRSEAPVRWNRSADGMGFWSLTRALDIRQVNQDPETFSSARGGIFLSPEALAPIEFARNFPIYKDPPEHDLYRSIVAQAFSQRAMGLLDQEVRKIVIGALDRIRARGATGECDLVRDLAVPVPVAVIGRMMGSVDEDIDTLLSWTQAIQDGMTYARDATATFQQMAEYYMGLVNSSRIPGVENLVRSIRRAEIDGRKLDDDEIALYLGMLLYAGNQPTRDAISAGLQVLIQHPDQMELLRQHPNLLKPLRSGAAPSPLVEILRWTSPACYFARTATKTTTIGGVPIKAGDRVVMWYASANRDPEVIPDPDTFDITRDANSVTHCSFGGGGPHHCQGDFLAHKTIYHTVHEAIKRLGDLEVVGPVTRVSSTFANSLTSLPVRFTPATDPRPVPAQLRPNASLLPRLSAPAPHATRVHQPSLDRAGWWARVTGSTRSTGRGPRGHRGWGNGMSTQGYSPDRTTLGPWTSGARCRITQARRMCERVVLISAVGKVDAIGARDLDRMINRVLVARNLSRLVIDLTRVTHFSKRGVDALLRAQELALRAGIELRVVTAGRLVDDVLRKRHAIDKFHVSPDVELPAPPEAGADPGVNGTRKLTPLTAEEILTNRGQNS